MLRSLPSVRGMLMGTSVRMEGRRIYLNFTKDLLAKAQVREVDVKFEKNLLKLSSCLRLP